MKNRASCRWRAAGSSSATTLRPVVAADSLLVVAAQVVQAPNDKQQIEPMLERLEALPEDSRQAGNIARRQRLFQRGQRRALRGGPDRADDRRWAGSRIIRPWRSASLRRRPRRRTRRRSRLWRHRLQTPEGKRLYALRKQIPEPVFGIIKSVMGFRQFLLRGLDQRPRRVEPRHHGVEHEANVRSDRRLRRRSSRAPARGCSRQLHLPFGTTRPSRRSPQTRGAVVLTHQPQALSPTGC